MVTRRTFVQRLAAAVGMGAAAKPQATDAEAAYRRMQAERNARRYSAAELARGADSAFRFYRYNEPIDDHLPGLLSVQWTPSKPYAKAEIGAAHAAATEYHLNTRTLQVFERVNGQWEPCSEYANGTLLEYDGELFEETEAN